ncbi:N-acetylmuramoyl-L-alanine amidase [Bacillus phage vB_BceM-HSE3]|nr:N-acetylmuramoyl-L-alanine amidase [Bacillus phage vB_BceM-HSE3]
MGFKMKYSIKQDYLPSGSLRRPGIRMSKVAHVVAHDTGNPGSSAQGNVNYYRNSAYEMEASAQLFVDDKNIIECIPALLNPPEKAWHVRYNSPNEKKWYGASNDQAIGVELCFGGSINFEEAYKRYLWVIAYICYKYGFSPTRVIGHEKLDPGRKVDPSAGLRVGGRTYDQLMRDIVAEYNDCTDGSSYEPPASGGNQGGGNSADGSIGIVRTKVNLNFRKEPNTSSEIIKTLPANTEWICWAEKDGWYNLGGGWVFGSSEYATFISNGTSTPTPPPVTPPSGGSQAVTGVAYITADVLNVRSEPSTNAAIVKKVYNGESYKVFAKQGDWYNVGGNQWISANYVRFVPDGSSAPVTGTAYIKADVLNVRNRPSMDGTVVKKVYNGEAYKVFAKSGDWYCVGGDQWISANSEYVRFVSN